MPSAIALPLSGLFVFLAGFNVWIMLSGRGTSLETRTRWAQAHRIAGYTFISLFVIFCYFMLSRIKGEADELPPRLILHMGLALVLAPLLLVKVTAVRYQQASLGVLTALGTGIFSISFTVVAVNTTVHYLREASPHKVHTMTSVAVIAAAIVLATILFLRNR